MHYTTLTHWVEHHAQEQPHADALIEQSTGECWTWRMLWHRAMSIASLLIKQGVRHDERVAVVLPNCPHHIAIFTACTHLGAIFTPINPKVSKTQLETLLERIKPTCVIVSDDTPKDAQVMAHKGALYLSDLNRAVDVNDERLNIPRHNHHEHEHALMLFTSGSTGTPKGVLLSYKALWWTAHQFVESLHLTPSDRYYACAPMHHSAGLNTMLTPLLYLGGTTVIAPAFSEQAMFDSVREHRITCTFMVPTMWRRLMHDPSWSSETLDSLRLGLIGGAPSTPDLLQRYADIDRPLTIGYGMTETGPMGTVKHPIDGSGINLDGVNVGAPHRSMSITILNEHGAECHDGDVGQIYIQGPNLMSGYWAGANQPPSRAAIEARGFATRDLGRRLFSGDIQLVGRCQEMIITGGENVYPIEIEQALYRVYETSITRCAVFGLPCPIYGEHIVAVLVPRNPTHHFVTQHVRDALRTVLSGHQLPRDVHTYASVPLTPTGKIDRHALKQDILNKTTTTAAHF